MCGTSLCAHGVKSEISLDTWNKQRDAQRIGLAYYARWIAHGSNKDKVKPSYLYTRNISLSVNKLFYASKKCEKLWLKLRWRLLMKFILSKKRRRLQILAISGIRRQGGRPVALLSSTLNSNAQ